MNTAVVLRSKFTDLGERVSTEASMGFGNKLFVGQTAESVK